MNELSIQDQIKALKEDRAWYSDRGKGAYKRWQGRLAKLEAEAKKQNMTNTVDYANQCFAFAPNSVERCSQCRNHPGEHSFPVTAQRDEAVAALKLVSLISNGIGAADLGIGQSETVLLAPKTVEQITKAIANASGERLA